MSLHCDFIETISISSESLRAKQELTALVAAAQSMSKTISQTVKSIAFLDARGLKSELPALLPLGADGTPPLNLSQSRPGFPQPEAVMTSRLPCQINVAVA